MSSRNPTDMGGAFAGVPLCSRERCPSYDGKRCGETGNEPGEVCVPEVRYVVRLTEWIRAQSDATIMAIRSDYVEHVELNGHIDTAQEAVDYLDHEAMDSGDPGGKLRDFVAALRIVIEQLDRQRRRANWYEAAHTAGKAKWIEHATADLARERNDLRARLLESTRVGLESVAAHARDLAERSKDRNRIIDERNAAQDRALLLERLLERALRAASECDEHDSHRGVRLRIREEAGL